MPIRNQHRSARTPYLNRSRSAKKAAYVRVAGLIRRAAPVLGGRFYTRSYMDGLNSWIDLYFLGHGYPDYFNVAMITTRNSYKELVLHEAFRRAKILAPDEDDWMADTVKDPKTGHYITPARTPKLFLEFGGLSRFDWITAQEKVIANEKTVFVHEKWTVRRDYYSGIGLHITLDVPAITIQVVNDFIDRFLANPTSFCNPQPLTYLADEIEDWGLDANAVAEPWDWPTDTGE